MLRFKNVWPKIFGAIRVFKMGQHMSEIFYIYFLSRMDKYGIKIINGSEHDSYSREWAKQSDCKDK
jgi:hypothetical protein